MTPPVSSSIDEIMAFATFFADIFLKLLKGPIIKGYNIFVKNLIKGNSIRNLSPDLAPSKCPGLAITT